MKTYYIYHIPTYKWKSGKIGKIGCTEQKPVKRVKNQGYTDFEVLEQHEDIHLASNREQELQKQYGYPVDSMPYWKTIKTATPEGCRKGGKIAVESGQLKKVRSLGGKKGGKRNVESGHIFQLGKMNAELVKTCPHCGKTIKGLNYKRWHGNNCKSRLTIQD
jgi:hypothetical protein